MNSENGPESHRGTLARGTGRPADPYRLPAVTVVARTKAAGSPASSSAKSHGSPAELGRGGPHRATSTEKGGRAIAGKGVERYKPEQNVPLGNFRETVAGRQFHAFGLDIGRDTFDKQGVGPDFAKVRDAYIQQPGSAIVIRGSASPSVQSGRRDADLSDRRARSAKAALVALGIPAGSIRIEPMRLSTLNPRAISPEQKATMRGASIELLPPPRRPHTSDGFTDEAFLTETAEIPTDAQRTAATLRKLSHAITIARTFRMKSALSALAHYLDNTGTFVEIPRKRVDLLREDHEAQHRREFLGLLRPSDQPGDGFVSRTALALELTADPTKLTAQSVRMPLQYATPSPKEHSWNDQLEYTGLQIRSDVVVEATRTGDLHYQMKIISWRSYAIDNYDWDGSKQALWNSLLPSQEEMRDLANQGLAKPYQRSSRSWDVDVSSLPSWDISFRDAQDLKRNAAARKEKISNRPSLQPGELPAPRAAEEM